MSVRVHVCVRVHVGVRVHVCVRVRVGVCLRAVPCVHVLVRACVRACMRACVRAHKATHTPAHMRTSAQTQMGNVARLALKIKNAQLRRQKNKFDMASCEVLVRAEQWAAVRPWFLDSKEWARSMMKHSTKDLPYPAHTLACTYMRYAVREHSHSQAGRHMHAHKCVPRHVA